MKNTELAELLLTTLYDNAETEGHGKIVVLDNVAKQFGVTDRMKIFNLAKYLESRGMIHPIYAGSGTLARITGEGAIFVERGGDTGIIPKYRKEPNSFVVNIDSSTRIYGDVSNSTVAVNSPGSTQSVLTKNEIGQLLTEIVKVLNSDTSLSKTKLADALQDIETLKLQLARSSRSKSVIEAILINLANIASIGSFIAQVSPLILK